MRVVFAAGLIASATPSVACSTAELQGAWSIEVETDFGQKTFGEPYLCDATFDARGLAAEMNCRNNSHQFKTNLTVKVAGNCRASGRIDNDALGVAVKFKGRIVGNSIFMRWSLPTARRDIVSVGYRK